MAGVFVGSGLGDAELSDFQIYHEWELVWAVNSDDDVMFELFFLLWAVGDRKKLND